MKYHVALIKKSDERVVVQLRREKDVLSPDIWVYVGCWTTSKVFFRQRKPDVLDAINTQYGTGFTKVMIR